MLNDENMRLRDYAQVCFFPRPCGEREENCGSVRPPITTLMGPLKM